MGRASQLWPLQVALVAAIEGSGALAARLAGDKVYNGQAPTGSPFPYITLGFAQEADDNTFNRLGTLAGQVLDVWTRKTTVTGGSTQELGARELVQIIGDLRYLLHEQPLTVAGFKVVRGTISTLATMEDPSGDVMHGIVRYDVTSREQ